jgi:hypothetical protein
MGRPRVDDAVMPGMYLVQICFGLSNLACEEQVWDSAATGRFVGVAPEGVPDATTLCKFRHLLEESGIGTRMFNAVAESAEGRGLQMSRSTVLDAAFVESPSSTKNSAGRRDPDAHQARKGQSWHFGYKLGIGVDAESGVPHSARTDAESRRECRAPLPFCDCTPCWQHGEQPIPRGGGRMAGHRAKLTEQMVEQALRLKADSPSNSDIISALGIHPSTFYRWIGKPRNRLQCELRDGLKKRMPSSSGRC